MNYIVEKDFMCNGFRCVIIFTRLGHRCGYIGVNSSSKLYGMDYDELNEKANIRVHGGLTFSSDMKFSDYPVESDLWWFGFDCAHWGDGKDLKLAEKYFKDNEKILVQIKMMIQTEEMFGVCEEETIRSEGYVENELKNLSIQLDSYLKIIE